MSVSFSLSFTHALPMRLPVWTVCFLLLPFAACDSNEDALEPCSFEATASGSVGAQLAGEASFDRLPSNEVRVNMADIDEDSLRYIEIFGPPDSFLQEGSFSFDPDDENAWFGSVQNTSHGGPTIFFRATGGTVRITSAVISENPDGPDKGRLEGDFTMDAESEDGSTVTIEGAFNAGVFPFCRIPQ